MKNTIIRGGHKYFVLQTLTFASQSFSSLPVCLPGQQRSRVYPPVVLRPHALLPQLPLGRAHAVRQREDRRVWVHHLLAEIWVSNGSKNRWPQVRAVVKAAVTVCSSVELSLFNVFIYLPTFTFLSCSSTARVVFWLGDLNFRIQDHGMHFIRSCIKNHDYGLLWSKDQVRNTHTHHRSNLSMWGFFGWRHHVVISSICTWKMYKVSQ